MDQVFAALADPTRRSLLERLRREGALSVTQLATPLDISRQATTKHLDQLSACGLVRAHWVGRERRHELVPSALSPVAEWLQPYAQAWDRRLERLAKFVDGEPEPNYSSGQSSGQSASHSSSSSSKQRK